MKLIVLGKYGPYPIAGGATSGYLLQEGNITLALDFGTGILGRIDRFCKVEELDGIVLSHLHFDHTSDLLPLSYRLKSKIKLYLPAIAASSPMGALLQSLDCYDIVKYDESTQIKIGDVSVTFASMLHPVPSFASRFESNGKTLVYTGDTVYCDKLTSFCKGATAVLADASQKENAVCPHMTVADADVLKKTSGAGIVYCTHVPPVSPGEADKYGGLVGVQECMTYLI